jgi:hypothetical protein
VHSKQLQKGKSFKINVAAHPSQVDEAHLEQKEKSSLQTQELSQPAKASTPAGLNTACTASYVDFSAAVLLLRSP